MKKAFLTITLALIAAFSFAQDIPVGIRNEITEAGEDDNEYSIFTYKDEDGTFGYYLSLGRVYNILEVYRESDRDFSIDHIDETCLYMGANLDDAFACLESLLNLLEEDLGTTREFPCRLTNGGLRLTDHCTATCIVVKRFLQRRRLCFHFPVGHRTAEVDLTRSAIKSLRWNLDLAKKMHLTD